jgi:hypothetical protein
MISKATKKFQNKESDLLNAEANSSLPVLQLDFSTSALRIKGISISLPLVK